jgi:hypothetical protein
MIRGPQTGARVLGLALGLLLAARAEGAMFHDRNVDGRHYLATVTNGDFGSYEGVDVRFQGDHAYVHLPGGGRLVLILESDEIEDPHEIPAHDPRRGITWILDVKDLAAD